jgi:tetratricopeptide (TPR) repeat protein/DNA-binding NarL/FixJ family response regulator
MRKKSLLCTLLFIFLLPFYYAQTQAFDSLSNEINRAAIYQKTKSLEMLERLYQMANNNADTSLLLACCLYEESTLNFRQGIVDSLLTYRIKQRLDHKHLSLLEQALLQSALGTSLASEGDYTDAFPLQLQALETFKQLKNNRFIARTLNALGNICRIINLLGLAEYYHTEAAAYFTPNSYEYYHTKATIFRILSMTKSGDAAVDSLINLLEIAEKENYVELLPVLYFNIGAHYSERGSDKSLPYFTKILSLNFDNPKSMAALYATMGSYYSGKKDYAKAFAYYSDAQKIMESNNDFFNLPILYNELAFLFAQQSRYDSAFYYSNKTQELTLRKNSHLAAIETHQKYITTFLEASQNELIIAEQTIQLKSKQFIIIAIVAGSTVLLILLLLLLVNQQKRRKITENHALTEKLEHEEKMQQYEKEKQEAMLDAKTREITTYSLLVSNKNNLLKQIMELNEQTLNNKDNTAKIASKIHEIIKSNFNIDEEWTNFKIHFDKVHPHFFEKLKQVCPDLTEDNLKMCAYIKIGMTNKQIAQLLNVAHNSVIISRYRIKKKLQLSEEEDLGHFVGRL